MISYTPLSFGDARRNPRAVPSEAAMAERIFEEVLEMGVNVICLCDDTATCAACGETLEPVGLKHLPDGESMECRCLRCGDSCFCEAQHF